MRIRRRRSPAESLDGLGPCRFGRAEHEGGIVDDAAKLRRQSVRRFRIAQKSALFVGQAVLHAADAGGHDGKPGRHRLDHSVAERFVVRRLNHDVRRAQQRRDVLRRAVEDHVRQSVVRRISPRGRTGIEGVVGHIGTDENQDGVAIDSLPRLQQIHNSLFDAEPADIQAQQRIVRPARLFSKTLFFAGLRRDGTARHQRRSAGSARACGRRQGRALRARSPVNCTRRRRRPCTPGEAGA